MSEVTNIGTCSECSFFNTQHKRLNNSDRKNGLGICTFIRMNYEKMKPTDSCEYWEQGDSW